MPRKQPVKRGPGKPPPDKPMRRIGILVRPDQEVWLRLHPNGGLSPAMREIIDKAIYGESQEVDDDD